MAGKIYDSPAAALEGLLFNNMTVMSGGRSRPDACYGICV
jgi:hypothetical protein